MNVERNDRIDTAVNAVRSNHYECPVNILNGLFSALPECLRDLLGVAPYRSNCFSPQSDPGIDLNCLRKIVDVGEKEWRLLARDAKLALRLKQEFIKIAKDTSAGQSPLAKYIRAELIASGRCDPQAYQLNAAAVQKERIEAQVLLNFLQGTSEVRPTSCEFLVPQLERNYSETLTRYDEPRIQRILSLLEFIDREGVQIAKGEWRNTVHTHQVQGDAVFPVLNDVFLRVSNVDTSDRCHQRGYQNSFDLYQGPPQISLITHKSPVLDLDGVGIQLLINPSTIPGFVKFWNENVKQTILQKKAFLANRFCHLSNLIDAASITGQPTYVLPEVIFYVQNYVNYQFLLSSGAQLNVSKSHWIDHNGKVLVADPQGPFPPRGAYYKITADIATTTITEQGSWVQGKTTVELGYLNADYITSAFSNDSGQRRITWKGQSVAARQSDHEPGSGSRCGG